jgi:hypothetical protein
MIAVMVMPLTRPAGNCVVRTGAFLLILFCLIEIGSPGDQWLRGVYTKAFGLARGAAASVIRNL